MSDKTRAKHSIGAAIGETAAGSRINSASPKALRWNIQGLFFLQSYLHTTPLRFFWFLNFFKRELKLDLITVHFRKI